MGRSQRTANTTIERAGKVTTITITADVNVDADEVLRAARDFSERRELVFPAVSTKRLTVHELAETRADVTEGTRAGPFIFWERCNYDWSQPGRVTAVVTASNNYATPESSWSIVASPSASGSTVTMTWQRRFRGRPIARVMGFVFGHFGARLFTTYACDVLDNLEDVSASTAAGDLL
jgi:hypothetical protein